MKFAVLPLLLVWIPVYVSAQNLTKVIIVDTLEGVTSNFKIAALGPDTTFLSLDDYYAMDDTGNNRNIIKAHVDCKKRPNLQLTIQLPCPNAYIQLPLDDFGGNILIHNPFATNRDTLHIGRFKVYHNCLPDSISNEKVWVKSFPLMPDSLEYLDVELSKTEISKDCYTNCPDSISLNINGKGYTTLVSIAPLAGTITHYNGYKKMSQRKKRILFDKSNNGRPYIHFWGTRVLKKYAHHSELTLS